MKKVLVIMSAGTKLGNTDRLTDAYIKGLVERGHSVTKVYLGSMRIEGCRGLRRMPAARSSMCSSGWYAGYISFVCRM